jgi:hypothetical protein
MIANILLKLDYIYNRVVNENIRFDRTKENSKDEITLTSPFLLGPPIITFENIPEPP